MAESTKFQEITKEEALAAAREASWAKRIATCGHIGCEDYIGDGPRYIHVFSGFGMDMPLEDVEEEILAAEKVGWTNHILRHDLMAVTGEWVHCYDVRRPGVSAGD